MPAPSTNEQIIEIKIINIFGYKYKCDVLKVQEIKKDNGGADGILQTKKGQKKFSVELRRKGFINHRNESHPFKDGWQNEKLVNEGIYLNTSTIEKYKETGFLFIVQIRGDKDVVSKMCWIGKDRVEKLLLEEDRLQPCGNDKKKKQFVKFIPVSWFELIEL